MAITGLLEQIMGLGSGENKWRVAEVMTVILPTGVKNMGRLALVALPVFFLLVWVQALLGGAARGRDLGYILETGGFYYLASVLYVLLGGLVHQLLVLCLLRTGFRRARPRVVALLLSPVIPLALSLGGGLRTVQEFLIPTSVALAIYVFLMKLPSLPEQEDAGRRQSI
ncbi:MAG: hypothetical protein SFU57_07080 [Gemmatimonadales bacterium]|nr:hypothetical protein [Gemmatimonadales bacterium]